METVPFLYYFMAQNISCSTGWEILSFSGRIVTVLWTSTLALYPLLV